MKQFLLADVVNARRIFGEKELGIMLKQMQGLVLTQSERNRLSRDIRPKLEFIKQLTAFQDEFRLERNQDNKRIIKNVVDLVLSDVFRPQIKAILLFGSFADNSFTNRSDIDVCVVFRGDISLKDATEFRIRILGECPDKVDLQVFNFLPFKLKREIARNHKVLFADKDFDNLDFSVRYLKDEDFFIRSNRILEVKA